LLGDLYSGLSIVQVRNKLKVGDSNWHVLEDNVANAPKDAPYHFVVIAVGDFVDLDERGEMRLQFFNDRLVGVWFYPGDPQKYKAKLEKGRNIVISPSAGTIVGAHTEIRFANDYSGRRYMAYEDVILKKEHEAWLAKRS
jgi:hypothetical protein